MAAPGWSPGGSLAALRATLVPEVPGGDYRGGGKRPPLAPEVPRGTIGGGVYSASTFGKPAKRARSANEVGAERKRAKRARKRRATTMRVTKR